MEAKGIACIVMAAGAATRFGGDKLAARLGGKSLLRRALETAQAPCFDRHILVGRADMAPLAEELGFSLMVNDRPQDGASRSVRLGLDAVADCAAALFLAADQPLLRRETVELLVAAWRDHPAQIVCAAHDNVRGNPCLFPARFFPALTALTGDTGGGAVIRAHPEQVRLVEVPAVELLDADTPQALAELALML